MRVLRMPNSRRWGIYDSKNILVEGGFFDRTAALNAADTYCSVCGSPTEGEYRNNEPICRACLGRTS